MAYRAKIKGIKYDPGEWDDVIKRYGITNYRIAMNHWESWVEVDFPNESYYNMFKIEFSEYI